MTPEAPPDDPAAPSARSIAATFLLSLAFVLITRLPVARPVPLESDELGFLRMSADAWFPRTHTLYLTLGKAAGLLVGDPYRGFVAVNTVMSAVALTSVWWWLRAVLAPAAAAASAALLACAPVFWGYGGMAGNYAGILAVGSFLLGVAHRTHRDPRPWHPFAAAAALALGAGYRLDIGLLWSPVLAVILWQHRWRRAGVAAALFAAISVAWLAAMLADSGGWSRFRGETGAFARSAGYLNSVFHLGLLDAPVRYAVKLVMALAWTLGPILLFVPRGVARLRSNPDARFLGLLLVLSVAPALILHLLIHFGVPGYAFHYVPALLALGALGVGRTNAVAGSILRRPAPRLALASALLAALFLFYPTDYRRPGPFGDFDLAFARFTRIGLRTPPPDRQPSLWRTANSRAGSAAAPPLVQ